MSDGTRRVHVYCDGQAFIVLEWAVQDITMEIEQLQ